MQTVNWAGNTPWVTIKGIVRHEYYGLESVDVIETSLAIFRHLLKNGTFDKMRETPYQWLADEYLHLAVLDYFSMFEPIRN